MKKIYKIIITLLFVISFWGISSVNSEAATANKSWESVYDGRSVYDESVGENFIYYVKYGELKIATNNEMLYLKKGKITKKIKISRLYGYEGALTNGKAVLYQYKNRIYLWEKNKTKMILKLKSNCILVGRYGSKIYFGQNIAYSDDYLLHSYDLKTHKSKKFNYVNAYYCNGKYLVIDGQFHEGISTKMELLDLRTGEKTFITSKANYGVAAHISGNTLYYMEYDFEKSWTCKSYNLKTKKRKLLKKMLTKGTLSGPLFLDKNHYYRSGKKVYVYNIKTGRRVVWGEG